MGTPGARAESLLWPARSQQVHLGSVVQQERRLLQDKPTASLSGCGREEAAHSCPKETRVLTGTGKPPPTVASAVTGIRVGQRPRGLSPPPQGPGSPWTARAPCCLLTLPPSLWALQTFLCSLRPSAVAPVGCGSGWPRPWLAWPSWPSLSVVLLSSCP